jgi:hypothetical protein
VRYRGKAAAVLRSGVFAFTSFPSSLSSPHRLDDGGQGRLKNLAFATKDYIKSRCVSQEARIGSAQGNDNRKRDAVKQQYWLYLSMQKHRNEAGSVRLYLV